MRNYLSSIRFPNMDILQSVYEGTKTKECVPVIPNILMSCFGEKDIFFYKGRYYTLPKTQPFRLHNYILVREPHTKVKNIYFYKLTDEHMVSNKDRVLSYPYKWKSSPQMPNSAVRLILEVLYLKLVRIHDLDDFIDDNDYKNFGIELVRNKYWKNYNKLAKADYISPKKSFISYWDKFYKEYRHGDNNSYESNPWVWAIDFKVVTNTLEDSQKLIKEQNKILG